MKISEKSFTQRLHVAMIKWQNKLENKRNVFARVIENEIC